MFCSHRGAVHSLPLTFKHICSVWYTSHSQFVSPWANTSIPPSPRTFCVLSSFPLLELPLTSCPIYFHSLFNLLWMGFHLCSSVVNRSESYLNFHKPYQVPMMPLLHTAEEKELALCFPVLLLQLWRGPSDLSIVLSIFLKFSTYSQNPSSFMRLAGMELRTHEYCSFTAKLLWRY